MMDSSPSETVIVRARISVLLRPRYIADSSSSETACFFFADSSSSETAFLHACIVSSAAVPLIPDMPLMSAFTHACNNRFCAHIAAPAATEQRGFPCGRISKYVT